MSYGSAAAAIRGDTPVLPAFDKRAFVYFGSTNNPNTITYTLGGIVVATRTFTYVGNGAANNDNIVTDVVVTPNPVPAYVPNS